MLGITKSYNVKQTDIPIILYICMTSSWYIYIAAYQFFSNDLKGAVPEHS